MWSHSPSVSYRDCSGAKISTRTQACLDPAPNLISEVPFTIPTKPGLLSDGGGTNTSPLGPQNPQISKREMSGHLSQTLRPILPG